MEIALALPRDTIGNLKPVDGDFDGDGHVDSVVHYDPHSGPGAGTLALVAGPLLGLDNVVGDGLTRGHSHYQSVANRLTHLGDVDGDGRDDFAQLETRHVGDDQRTENQLWLGCPDW